MSESARDLLEAIARALAEDVSPHVADRFAQMQCKAAAELLGNLAGELDWAPAPVQAGNRQLEEMLERLRSMGWCGDQAATPAGASPLEARSMLLAELGEALRWLSGQPAAARESVDALLLEDLERQVTALRRGMFR
jgi:hypothetical protein